MSARIRYLAYGSNMLPARLAERVPSARPLGTARLAGWAISFAKRGRDGSGKCTVARAPAHRIYGIVYEMTIADKRRLDAAEGLGQGYDETAVSLPAYGETRFYLAAPDWIDPALQPFDWYRALVVAGARHHALPGAYVALLAAGASLPDPDAARARRHLALLAARG